MRAIYHSRQILTNASIPSEWPFIKFLHGSVHARPNRLNFTFSVNRDVIYELPLNERIRTFLRLELLFEQTDFFLRQPSEWASRVVINCLLDISTISSRTDLKTEITKEIERHSKSLNIIAQNPGIDQHKLSETLNQLRNLNQQIHSVTGKIGNRLIQTDLLKTISQRISIPGGTCDFDVPVFHHWLKRPDEKRLEDLLTWSSEFDPYKQAIMLLLNFIRLSAHPTIRQANGGFYQQPLPQGQPFQMIRVIVDPDCPLFAEISGGRHRFSIRFMLPRNDERPVQTDKDIDFKLALCNL